MSFLELKIPPAILWLVFAALMKLLAAGTPHITLPHALRLTLFILSLALSAAIGAAGIWSFRKAKTTINPHRPHATSTLVTSGIYQHTRNPMYLSLFIALLGWAAYLSNPYAALLPIAFALTLNRLQIIPEERAMEKQFGQSFHEYKSRAGRWL
ncbi:hypothetical protein VDG1235_1128 [Verrucomicrobiia bacterium DG1235]|nr:hypothetical protein VDG1235_1128 [Verrucomicrobiae bacterium DG1235]